MAEDSGQLLEKMMELGIGLTMIKQMPTMMEGMMPKPSSPSTIQGPAPPSQPARTQYYMVADNAQAGPFTEEELIKLIQNDLLRQDTLVWKTGMAAWTPAAQVPEVNKLFILAKLNQK